MRYYELMMVVSPQLDDEGMTAALDRVNRYVNDRGGSVVRQEQWGRLRRLAYPIRNFSEGNYVLTHLEMDPQDTRDLEASLHLAEDVLRHLLVKIDAIPPAPAPRAEPAEAAAAEATEATTEAAQAETAADDAQPAPAAESPEAATDTTETAAESTEPEAAADAAASEPEAAADTPVSEAAAEESAEPAAEEPAAGEASST